MKILKELEAIRQEFRLLKERGFFWYIFALGMVVLIWVLVKYE